MLSAQSRFWLFTVVGLLGIVTLATVGPTLVPVQQDLTLLPRADSLRERSRISDADLVVDERFRVHVVFSVTRGFPGHAAGSDVFYVRGTPQGKELSWERPRRLISKARAPRIVLVGRDLHVVADAHLVHVTSRDNGDSWAALPSLAPVDSLVAEGGHEVASDGRRLFVVARTRWGGARSFHFTAWKPGGEVTVRRLGTSPFGGSFAPAPRIVLAGRTIHVLCPSKGIFELRETRGGDSSAVAGMTGGGRLEHAQSDDGGDTWTALETLPTRGDARWELPDGVDLMSSMACDLVTRDGRVRAYLAHYDLVRFDLGRDGRWTRTELKKEVLCRGAIESVMSPQLDVIALPKTDLVTLVRWPPKLSWAPLRENEVRTGAVAHSVAGRAFPHLDRLNVKGSRARGIRVAERGRLYTLWAGQSQVTDTTSTEDAEDLFLSIRRVPRTEPD